MTEKTFDFWQDHSEKFLEMALRTDKDEKLHNPDGHGINSGDCGDTIELFLSMNSGRIDSLSFHIDGCVNTRACAYTLAMLVEGKTLKQAWEIKTDDIVNYLETLPEASHHCAELAVGALYRALAHYQTICRDPWKKNYISM